MSRTVIALYDDFETARRVVEALADAGFDRSNISLIANDASGTYADYLNDDDATTDDVKAGEGAGFGAVVGTLIGLGVALIPGIGPVVAAGPLAAALMAGVGAAAGAVTGGAVAGLVDLGVPEDEAQHYAEGIRRGGALVSITVDDNSVNRAQEIMNQYDPVDMDRRTTGWRENSGYTGFSTNAQPYSVEQISTERERYRTLEAGEEARLDVVEEELQVGKREVERGGVRVRSFVTETPVSEDITLREERVRVDRRSVDRPATAADLSAFDEGVIEVTEHVEQPVVSKTARVVEEVVIGKDVTEHTETVTDTVRRKDVEVENVTGTTARTTGTTGTSSFQPFETYDTTFRTHYNSSFANSGYTYDQYMPAYRYGYNLATNDRYTSHDWNSVETDARRYWEERNPNTWDQFKAAVRQAWDEIRGRR